MFRPLICFALLTSSSLAVVDYGREIKPLLKTHCVKCHGATTQKAKLRLDTAAAAVKGGGRGAAVKPGMAEESLLIQAVRGKHGELPQMPYKRGPLDSVQIETLQRWVNEGAKAPANERPSDDRHWAYIAPKKPAGGSQSIDSFIEARLKKEGLSFSAEAAPGTLIRRLHLDLTGLPPTPAEVAAFVQDGSPVDVRISALISRLLASPHYGERWGRWWLDQARYADSNGYSIDAPRSIWPYRDWVVQALNADMPYDQFSIEQLAGDLLHEQRMKDQGGRMKDDPRYFGDGLHPASFIPQPSSDLLIATGFHRNTQINQEGGIDKEQFRIESVFDRVATTGTVWLGLTIGCAQCHDHKFDAISQREYYRMFAFLNNQDEPTLSVVDPRSNREMLEAQYREVLKKMDTHLLERLSILQEWEKELGEQSKKLLTPEAVKSMAKPVEKRTIGDQRILFKAMTGTADPIFNPLYDRHLELEAALKNGTTTLVMKELPQPRKTTLFIKGDFTRPAEEVQPGVPAVLPALKSDKPSRLDFARWLVARENPLTARVIVNRVWQQYFGHGLVETENDLGTMGSLPTHPELLDWLAVELMDSGWSLKHLHRLIVSSRTYRQSSAVPSAKGGGLESTATSRETSAPGSRLDPNNRLLWRQNRLRLDAEIVRDVCLTACGLVSEKMDGPPVYPPIPEGVMGLGQVKRAWPLSKGEDRYRRGLYTFVFRATPPPGLSVFDAPDGFSSCTRRLRSNTPLQALTLLNDSASVEFAQALARIIGKEGVEAGFIRCTARRPTAQEKQSLAGLDPMEAARVLLNLDETITRE